MVRARSLTETNSLQPQTGQTSCQMCPNNDHSQQGYSAPGATGTDQCFPLDGALTSCSQVSNGTCPMGFSSVSTPTATTQTPVNPNAVLASREFILLFYMFRNSHLRLTSLCFRLSGEARCSAGMPDWMEGLPSSRLTMVE